jgi:hypothetical protein
MTADSQFGQHRGRLAMERRKPPTSPPITSKERHPRLGYNSGRLRGLVCHRQPAPVRPAGTRPGRQAIPGHRGRVTASAGVPVRVVWKPVMTDADAIRRAMLDANSDDT